MSLNVNQLSLMLFYFNQLPDESVEENTQFSLEAIDLDEDIERTDELFRNEDVEEDCLLLEEEISSLDFFIISLLFYLS